MRIEDSSLLAANISWCPNTDIENATLTIVADLELLLDGLESLDKVWAPPAAGYIREQLALIRNLMNKLPSDEAAEELLTRFYELTFLDEELDRMYGKDINSFIDKIKLFSREQIVIERHSKYVDRQT